MKKARILLADDHDLVRRGLRSLIESEWSWEVCGEARDGLEAVALAKKLRPEIVVLDVGMPELNGVEATRQIKRALPETEVLILTGEESEDLVHQILVAGARGYLLKSECGAAIIPAIKALCAGQPYLSSRAAQVVLASYLMHGPGAREEAPGGITPREREVVQLLAEGKSNKESAAALGISVKTAESHRAAIMRKLEMNAFSELVRYAVRNKIVPP